MNLVLFDIDGTLVRTHGAGSRATNRTFLDLFGAKEAWGTTKAFGKTDHNIFDEIAQRVLHRRLTDRELAEVCAVYLHHFAEELHRAEAFTVLPGISELVHMLAEQEELWLGVQTGNLEPAGWLKLRTAGLEPLFRFGGFAEDARDRTTIIRSAVQRGTRQLTQMGHTCDAIIVIGDTPSDVQAGKENGAKTIAVATGGYTREELERCAPDVTLDSCENVEATVETFLQLFSQPPLQT